jgi:hypothetical protein
MNPKLCHDGRGDHERIDVGLAHGAADIVHSEHVGKPGADQLLDGLRRYGSKLTLAVWSPVWSILGRTGHARSFDHLKGVNDVEIVRPGFRKILPRMCRRILGDELRELSRTMSARAALAAPGSTRFAHRTALRSSEVQERVDCGPWG